MDFGNVSEFASLDYIVMNENNNAIDAVMDDQKVSERLLRRLGV